MSEEKSQKSFERILYGKIKEVISGSVFTTLKNTRGYNEKRVFLDSSEFLDVFKSCNFPYFLCKPHEIGDKITYVVSGVNNNSEEKKVAWRLFDVENTKKRGKKNNFIYR